MSDIAEIEKWLVERFMEKVNKLPEGIMPTANVIAASISPDDFIKVEVDPADHTRITVTYPPQLTEIVTTINFTFDPKQFEHDDKADALSAAIAKVSKWP